MYSGSDTDDNELLSHDVTSGEKQITSDEVTNTSAGGGTTGNKHAADAPITHNPSNENTEGFPSLSSASSVKHRERRKPSEKGKLNKINFLRSEIPKLIRLKLQHYEKNFSEIDKANYDNLYDFLSFLEEDGKDLDTLYVELEQLCENKVDSTIKSLCLRFHNDRKDNIDAVNILLDEIEKREDAELTKMEEDLRKEMEGIELQRRSQADARKAFTERMKLATAKTKSPAPSGMQNNESGAFQSLHTETNPQHTPRARPTPTPRLQANSELQVSPTYSEPLRLQPASTPHTALDSHQLAELGVMERLANSITESVKSSKRTIIEPSVFYGDIMSFKDWETDFDDFLDSEGITTSRRKLRMLKKFVEGEAKTCIAGFLWDESEASYVYAREYLRERYGKKINISKAFKKKLKEWPKVSGKDSQGLQQYADFLAHLLSAKQNGTGLGSLDEQEANEEMMEKLPEWAQNKWKSHVHKYYKATGEFPPFDVFKEFVSDEAASANILGNSKGSETGNQTRNNPRKIQTLHTTTITENQEHQPYCKNCKLDNHHTAQCGHLIKADFDKVMQFFLEHKLCFTCGNENHRQKDCPKRWRCKFCQRDHPDCLHKTAIDWNREKSSLPPVTYQDRTEDKVGDP